MFLLPGLGLPIGRLFKSRRCGDGRSFGKYYLIRKENEVHERGGKHRKRQDDNVNRHFFPKYNSREIERQMKQDRVNQRARAHEYEREQDSEQRSIDKPDHRSVKESEYHRRHHDADVDAESARNARENESAKQKFLGQRRDDDSGDDRQHGHAFKRRGGFIISVPPRLRKRNDRNYQRHYRVHRKSECKNRKDKARVGFQQADFAEKVFLSDDKNQNDRRYENAV